MNHDISYDIARYLRSLQLKDKIPASESWATNAAFLLDILIGLLNYYLIGPQSASIINTNSLRGWTRQIIDIRSYKSQNTTLVRTISLPDGMKTDHIVERTLTYVSDSQLQT